MQTFAQQEASVSKGAVGNSAVKSRLNLKTLQAGRGIAALAVVLHHLNSAIFGNANYFPRIFWKGFLFGYSGIEYFFVISGFLIFYIHGRDAGAVERVRSFLRKRFVRIYPVYWFVLLLILPVWVTKAFEIDRWSSFGALVGAITLLPTPYPQILGVAWTLVHEVLFYAAFALLIFNRRLGLAVMGAWLIGSVVITAQAFYSQTAALNPHPPLLSVLFSPLHILFLYGALSAWVLRRGKISMPWMVGLGGLALFLANGAVECYWGITHYEFYEILRQQIYGVGAALAIIGLVELERSNRLRVSIGIALLGDASYSIYLTHHPILQAAGNLLVRSHFRAMPMAISFALLATVAVAGGILFHKWVERPVLAWFR